MGKLKSLAFMLGGAGAFDLAAAGLNMPGLKDLGIDIWQSLFDGYTIGETARTITEYLGMYGRDFFYNGHAALGTVGQVSMYGGLGSLVYNLLKRPENPKEIAKA